MNIILINFKHVMTLVLIDVPLVPTTLVKSDKNDFLCLF
jgi:hypothetical protein